MRTLSLKRLAPYGASVVGVVIMAAIRLALEPIFGDDSPLTPFLIVVMVVSRFWGLGPGLLTTVLSILIGDYLFIAPKHVIFGFIRPYDPIRIGLFAFFGVLISVLNDRLQSSVSAERVSSERFRLLVDGAVDYALYMLDPGGRVVSWNFGAERLMGYRQDEIIGRELTTFYTPEDVERGRPWRELEIAAAEGRHMDEGLRVRRDGACYWANVLTTTLRDKEGRLRGFVNVARDVTERKLAEEALQKSKRFAQRIIEVSPCLIFIYDVNLGKNVFINRDIAAALGYDPETEAKDPMFLQSIMHPDDWLMFQTHLGRFNSLRDDEIIEFEFRGRARNSDWRWFYSRDKVFTRNEDGSVREIIGTATDITERRYSQEKALFLNTLNKTLRPLADPEEIKSTATRLLCERLDADRCAYAEVEEDENFLEITGDYSRGASRSMVGRFSLDDLGPEVLRLMRVNLPCVIDDIEVEAPAGRDISTYRREEIRALVCVPLHKNGRYVARMAVSQKTKRHWTREEVALVTIVANRCWESVQRARAVRNLKESEERYRAFIANSSEAIWRFELEQPIPITLPENDQIEMLYQYGYLAECNDAMARMYGYETADQLVGARIGDILIRSDPKNIAYLRAFKRAGYRLTDVETREIDRYGNTKYFLNNQAAFVENGLVVRGWGMQRDITELKRAERALRDSEERLRRITEATQDALWEIDLNTNQLWWSEGASRLFGRSPSELEIGLEDWYQGIHPEDVDRVRAKFHKFMLSPGICNWLDEYRFLRADGSYIYIHDQGRKFCGEDGKPARIAGAMVDITERKHAEQALRESEERYRLLIDLSPDGVIIAGVDGTIRMANRSMLRMLGVEPDQAEQVIGRNLYDFLTPEYLNHCRACLGNLMDAAIPATQVEAAFRRWDDGIFPAEINAVRFDWKGQPHAQIVIHDITGRKHAEAERERLRGEIEAERDRLRQILEQMPIGVSLTEAPSGRLLFHNPEAKRLLGCSALSSADLSGQAQYVAIREDGSHYRPEEYPAARSLLSGKVIKGEEIRIRRADGSKTYFAINSAPIRDQEGRVVSVVTTFVDVAERRRAEAALRESEERFSKAFRASPDGLVISRIADGVILEVNDSFVSQFGHARNDLIGKSTMEVGLYKDSSDRQRALAILKEKNYVRDFEFVAKRKSGETRLINFSAEPLELEGEPCWLTIVRDITERKRAEEALRNSEEQARRQLAQIEAIYATAPVGLCFVDAELRFISINERLAEINGRTVEEHMGRTIREVLSPEVADTVEPVMRRVIETGELASNIEISTPMLSNPNVLRHFIASYYPIKNGGGRALGINSVVVEITQRKRIEEERERLLRKEKEAREEAEGASRMKDEFLATISHELRTPLTSILGWARMLADGGLSKPQASHALEVIAQSAQSQTRLIEDILDTSRIITGRFKLDPHPVNVETVFRAAVDVIRPSAEAKGITLNATVDVSDCMVFGDTNRLQQALWNLLSNAVKFTYEGGRVEAHLGRTDGQIEITVSDTGIGVEPQFLPHVFERFRQADSASTREYGGLGLGLAIVRHIVEMHGGVVSASSPGKDQGATFKIRLPLASASAPPQMESRQLESEVKQMKEQVATEAYQRLDEVRVLLVEDNPDTLDMLKFIFDECGAEVVAATSVTEALDVLDRWRPDALVSDIAMPDQDGFDLIRQLRSRDPEHGGEIPAVAVTAYASAEDRVRTLAAGFQMHVAKPVDPDELIAVVASLTGHIHV
jgi:PAS domain S-box-containing protein